MAVLSTVECAGSVFIGKEFVSLPGCRVGVLIIVGVGAGQWVGASGREGGGVLVGCGFRQVRSVDLQNQHSVTVPASRQKNSINCLYYTLLNELKSLHFSMIKQIYSPHTIIEVKLYRTCSELILSHMSTNQNAD